MTCPICGKPVVAVDYPDMETYHTEDTEWLITPFGNSVDCHDPGILGSKLGTLPASNCTKTPR